MSDEGAQTASSSTLYSEPAAGGEETAMRSANATTMQRPLLDDVSVSTVDAEDDLGVPMEERSAHAVGEAKRYR
jgi:hypothetical protein